MISQYPRQDILLPICGKHIGLYRVNSQGDLRSFFKRLFNCRLLDNLHFFTTIEHNKIVGIQAEEDGVLYNAFHTLEHIFAV